MDELPLFPLRAVLFPDGLLELKIFEARYLDLMSRCLREGSGFAVVALKRGQEARRGTAIELYEVGTRAELLEVDSPRPGILLISCRGGRRVSVGATRTEDNGLWVGEVRDLPADPAVAPLEAHADVVEHLRAQVAALDAEPQRFFLPPYRFDEAGWVANRWCEVLPMTLEARQRLMAMPDPLARLDIVDTLLRSQTPTH